MIDITTTSNRNQHRKDRAVYCFCHSRTYDRYYVGSSCNLGRRIANHLSALRSGTHSNTKLQNAWFKYTESAFRIYLVEIIPENEDIILREQFWINYFDAFVSGFNLRPEASSNGRFTFNHTEEAKQKISSSLKNKPKSEEHRLALSVSHKDHKPTPEAISKAREANTGKKRSDASKKLIRSKRINNIDAANKTVRCSPGRKKEIPFKGVYAKGNRFQVRIKYKNKFLNLGSFETPEEAAQNYDFHSLAIFGRGECYLNFPMAEYKGFRPLKQSVVVPPNGDTAIVSVIYNP